MSYCLIVKFSEVCDQRNTRKGKSERSRVEEDPEAEADGGQGVSSLGVSC